MKCSKKYVIKFYEERFNDTENDPTEGLYGVSKWLYELYRLFAQSHARNRFIQRMINHQEGVSVRILDIGCGGGSQVIAKLGCVVGLDLAINGLKNATTMGRYMAGTVADAAFLPFSDSSFDYVISRDLLGHLPECIKSLVYEEMKRVCLEGGRLIHAIEVESGNPLMKWAQQHPQLYRKYFVLWDGHVGLESPTASVNRFTKHGFRLVKSRPLFRSGIVRVDTYLHFFDNEYRNKSMFMNWVVRLAKYADRHAILRGIWSFASGVLDTFLGSFLPFDWAQLLLVCFENTKRDTMQA